MEIEHYVSGIVKPNKGVSLVGKYVCIWTHVNIVPIKARLSKYQYAGTLSHEEIPQYWRNGDKQILVKKWW